MKKALYSIGRLAGALLICAAFALDLSPARAARPEAVDAFGYVYQLLARTFASVTMDRVVLTAMFALAFWLCKRYLFHKPQGTGAGEYLLSMFLGGMMLLCTAVRTEDTVAVLWANLFQLPKAAICFAGLTLLFLLLLRALREGLGEHSVRPWLGRLDEKATAGRLFVVIAACWLPQIIARYPGVLMWDSYLQIKQFVGQTERWANHPPFGTWLYGTVAVLGEKIGNKNLIYFMFTLLQCAACIAVLVYSLQVMKRLKVPAWVRLSALAVYALSPCYAGWQTVIAKDSSYALVYMLLATLLLECLFDPKHFFTKLRLIIFSVSCALLALCRHNGVAAVIAALAAVVFMHFKKARKALVVTVLCGVAGLVAAAGVETAIVSALQIQSRYIPDVMSLPFQQTARVASLHDVEMPEEERKIIGTVLDYDRIVVKYKPDYADSVKDTYRQTATAEDRAAYWRVWFNQMKRYPVDYVDATLHMNGVLFDLGDNEPMYICFSDNSLYDDVYPWSFNDMTMYESEKLVKLNSLNRTVTEFYMDFDQIPVIGWIASMSFHSIGLIAMLYVSWTAGRRKSMLWWLPNILSFVICLFMPVVYLRYALPYICAAPLGLAAFFAQGSEEKCE